MSLLIHTLPAETGDCFIIEVQNKVCILIDAGFPITYRKHLRPKLIEMCKEGKSIDLFVITHIDRDHISGAISFLEENGHHDNPKIIPIKEIWFNGLMALKAFIDSSSTLSLQNTQMIQNAIVNQMMRKSDPSQTGISVREAISFEQLCKRYGYALNTSFGGLAITEKISAWINSEFDLSIDVSSPSGLYLKRLANYANMELYKIIDKKASISIDESLRYIYECMLMEHDTVSKEIVEPIGNEHYTDISQWSDKNEDLNMSISIPNLSSIALVIRYNDKVLVFSGDAETDFIITRNINPQVIKLSHHGSFPYNKKLMNGNFECTYILSTNSKQFGHPSLRLLANLLMAAGKKHLHMNYPISKLDLLFNEEQQKKYNFSISCGNTFLLE